MDMHGASCSTDRSERPLHGYVLISQLFMQAKKTGRYNNCRGHFPMVALECTSSCVSQRGSQRKPTQNGSEVPVSAACGATCPAGFVLVPQSKPDASMIADCDDRLAYISGLAAQILQSQRNLELHETQANPVTPHCTWQTDSRCR